MKKALNLLIAFGLLATGSAWALSQVDASYADKLANGGSSTIRAVASNLVSVQGVDPEVYDVAAEVLLRDYQKSSLQPATIDALAWVTKALMASEDSRYLGVLQEVKENASHKKLRKYGKSTYSKLKKRASKSSPSYSKGMVKLSSYKPRKRNSNSRSSSSADNGEMLSISKIRVGMAAGEVYELCGRPTSEAANITGKAFNPFNFSGKGKVKTSLLYEGQGTVVLENTSAYTAGRRVVEVILDTYESGYR
jgi:hypothetical protein